MLPLAQENFASQCASAFLPSSMRHEILLLWPQHLEGGVKYKHNPEHGRTYHDKVKTILGPTPSIKSYVVAAPGTFHPALRSARSD